MNIGATVIAHAEASELVQPAQRSLHHPAVLAQAAAVRRAAMRNRRPNPARPQGHAMSIRVVRAIGIQQLRPLSGTTSLPLDGRNGIHQRNQLCDVVAVGCGERGRQRCARRVRKDVVFRAALAAIRGIGAGFFAPPTARTLALSTAALDQSIRLATCSRSSSTRWSFVHTPAWPHSSSRFHNVMPEQPISCGKSSHGMPVLSTNKIPVRHTRSGLRGWPPFRLGAHFGNSGSTEDHNSSLTKTLDMASSLMKTVASGDFSMVDKEGHHS